MRRERAVAIAAGILFVAVFLALRAYSGPRRSATFDEPIHLTAGYAALVNRDFSMDPTHPPLLRMLAALPMALSSPRPIYVPPAPGTSPSSIAVARAFLFSQPDADRYLARGRLIVSLIGAILGLLVAAWAYEWRGRYAALLAAVCFLMLPGIAAHAELVTTDLGATAFIFAGVYATWRLTRRFTWPRVVMTAAAVSLAVVTKFSGLILAPIIVTILAAAVAQRRLTMRQAASAAAATVALTVATVWACYGFRYAPGPAPDVLYRYDADAQIRQAAPALAASVGWVDQHRLLPNAFTQGFLYSQVTARKVPVFSLGRIQAGTSARSLGLLLLVKTPLAMLLLIGIGLAVTRTGWNRAGLALFTPVAMYAWAALAGGVTLGVRHLLPLYPFMLMFAVAGALRMWAMGPYRLGRAVVILLLGFWTVQFARTYPNTLTFFSSVVGGPDEGAAYLADSDLDWGQHLKLLKRWMDRNRVDQINLAYFGSADPHYYGITYTPLPAQGLVDPRPVSLPKLPGFVAVSATAQAGVYLSAEWRLFYEGLRTQTPVASIGHTISVYWLEQWPEAPTMMSPQPARIDATRALARNLIARGWVELGLRYYARYAARRENDVNALEEMGRAAAAAGRDRRAAAWLKRVTTLAPDRTQASQLLATVLLRQRDITGALSEARRGATLAPTDPAAHDLLGRALAAAGSLSLAAEEFRQALSLDPAFHAAALGLKLVETALRGAERLLSL